MTRDVPPGWRRMTLGEVAKWGSGGTPKRTNPSYFGGSIPWVVIGDLNDNVVSDSSTHITEDGLRASAAKWIPPGAVLLAMYGSIGKLGIAGSRLTTNQAIAHAIVDDQLVEAKYLFWFLRSMRSELIAEGKGGTQQNISQTIIRTLPIPVPPIHQQRQIVAAVEEQMSRIDNAASVSKGLVVQLGAYRRSLLLMAVTGRLGRASELAGGDGGPLEALPPGWTWVKWRELGTSQNGRAFPSKEYMHEGIKLLRPGNLHQSGRVEWEPGNTRYLPSDWADRAKAFVVGPGELIINLTAQSLRDEFLGRVCLTGSDDLCLLNQRLARLTPTEIDPRYLLWVFKSPLFRRFVRTLNTGSLIQHMFTSQLDEFLVPVPPPDEQVRISEEVERRISVMAQVARAVETNRRRAEVLREAVLRRAFAEEPTDSTYQGVPL